MSLDQRLRDARDDYRALTPPPATVDPGGVTGVDQPSSRPPVPHRTRWLAAAAVLLVVVASVATWTVTREREDRDRVSVAGPSTVATIDPQTTGAWDPSDVVLDPPGPYRDGQEVVVRVPVAVAEGADLLNEGLSLCARVREGDDLSETCDPTVEDLVVLDSLGPTSATVRLRRTVFTDTGRRDCNEATVDCRIVVLAGDGSRHASERLTFVDEDPSEPEVRLRVEPTGEPGEVTLTPSGLTADPSWLALRDDDPGRAGGFTPLYVSQCAFSASLGSTPGPFGDPPPWEAGDPDGVVCGAMGPALELDPDDPERAVTVTLPTLVYGYGGWADCRVDQCFLEVRRTIIHGIEPGGGTLGSDVSAATALLPRDGAWAEATRPTLSVETPGPHRAGQVVSVTISGLPAGERRLIAQCSVDQPWGCGYDVLELGNGTHEVTLAQGLLERCRPETCYLELDSSSEGLPPLAVAPLDTPG